MIGSMKGNNGNTAAENQLDFIIYRAVALKVSGSINKATFPSIFTQLFTSY